MLLIIDKYFTTFKNVSFKYLYLYALFCILRGKTAQAGQ
jgi:hypothetical protein